MFLSRTSSLMVLRRQSLRPLLATSTTTTSSRTFYASSPTNQDISKKDIVAEVAETHDLTVAKAERIVNTVFDSIVEAVTDDKSVRISKFGIFDSYLSAARSGRNPNTGETIQIPSKQRIRFKPSVSFKRTANGGI